MTACTAPGEGQHSMTAAWPHTDERLERAYRRLLLAYPGRYRHRHGPEIVTTLLELADPGQRRPARADAWHLIASGLRQRFRLPSGQPAAWVAAVLITLITGAFGAAAGSWAGVQTFAALPDHAALAEQVAGTGRAHVMTHDSSPWTHTGHYASAEVNRNWQAEAARQRLQADGWQVGPNTPFGNTVSTVDPATGAMTEIPADDSTFEAEKGDVVLAVSATLVPIEAQPLTAWHGLVHTQSWARATPVFLPLIVAGLVTGLLTGWLLAAAGTYRIRRSPRPRPATITGAVAVLTLALPAVAFYGNLLRAFEHAGQRGPAFTVHSALSPGDYFPFGPPWQILALTITGILLAGAAVALARPTPAATPQQAPATN